MLLDRSVRGEENEAEVSKEPGGRPAVEQEERRALLQSSQEVAAEPDRRAHPEEDQNRTLTPCTTL